MTSRSSSSGYSAAITGGQNFHARPGNETTTVTTTGKGSGLESFLGAMPDFTGHQKAGDIFARETFDQPDKYADEVQFLTGILDFFIVDQADFWCSKILPWRKTDSLHFAWNVWKFDRTVADIEPHQGVPRLVTSSRESRTSSLIRRGLAFMVRFPQIFLF